MPAPYQPYNQDHAEDDREKVGESVTRGMISD